MTIEEKLEKAIEFIRSIEKIDVKQYASFRSTDLLKQTTIYCPSCDDEIELELPKCCRLSKEFIDKKIVDDLSEKAWHILADLTW